MVVTSLRTIGIEASCLPDVTSVMDQLQVPNPIRTVLGNMIHAHLAPIRPTSCWWSEASIVEAAVLVSALHSSDVPEINENMRDDACDRPARTHKTIYIIV